VHFYIPFLCEFRIVTNKTVRTVNSLSISQSAYRIKMAESELERFRESWRKELHTGGEGSSALQDTKEVSNESNHTIFQFRALLVTCI